MRKLSTMAGFSIIELLVFIVVTSLLMSTIMLGAFQSLRKAPDVHNQILAIETAQRCLEWYLEQRRLNGFTYLTCPSSPSSPVCTAPSGLSVSTNIACTTWNGDSGFKTITVTVSGAATASLSVQIGNY